MSAAALRLARLIRTDPDRAKVEALRIETAAKAKRQRVLAKSRPRRRAEKESKEARDKAHRDLVAKVMERAEGWCELGHHKGHFGTDPHHLEPGPLKSKTEKISNVIAACRTCHDDYHDDPGTYVPIVKAWCEAHGYPLPRRREYR